MLLFIYKLLALYQQTFLFYVSSPTALSGEPVKPVQQPIGQHPAVGLSQGQVLY